MTFVPDKFDWLIEERNNWRKQMEVGVWQDPHILQEYRKNRESMLWRASRQGEKLCEYILFLEAKLIEKI